MESLDDPTRLLPQCRICERVPLLLGLRNSQLVGGMCMACYTRERKSPGKPPQSINQIAALTERQEQNFWAKVVQTPDCWLWVGAIAGNYGLFRVGRRTHPAHRVSLVLADRDPGPLQVDHLCNNGLCVNPAHLEAVTAQENLLRRYRRSGQSSDRYLPMSEDEAV